MRKLVVILLGLVVCLVLGYILYPSGEDKALSQDKLEETSELVGRTTSDFLKQKQLSYGVISVAPRTSEVEVVLDGRNIDYNQEETEVQLKQELQSEVDKNFDVIVREKTEAEIRDQNWQPVFMAVVDETEQRFKEYHGFAYSFHPEPLQIIIKTTLEDETERINDIESFVHTLVTEKMKKLNLEPFPYEIIIRGEDHQKLN